MIEWLRLRIPSAAAGEFHSLKLTFCADSYSVSVPPRVTAVALKRPRSFCQNTYTALIKGSRSGPTMLYRHSVETYQGNELTCNSSVNIWPPSSQLAEPLSTDSGLTSGNCLCELISTLKKKKKIGACGE